MLPIIKIEQLYEKKENRPNKEGHVVRAKIFYKEATIIPMFDTSHAAAM